MLACGHDPNGLKPGCRDCAALASRRGWFFHPPKAEAAAATPAPPPPPEPSLLQKAASLAGAVVQHVAGGMRSVSDDAYRGRINACLACEYRNGKPEWFSCRLCGCSMRIKARWAEQRCPHPKGSRWAMPLAAPALTPKPAHKPLAWSAGVTAVPARLHDGTLRNTLTSLRNAGFNGLHLFIDGDASDNEWKRLWSEFGVASITSHADPVRTAGNWWLTLWELFIRHPYADRYAIFQDDIACVAGLREYLERVEYPHRGYLNLYTFPENQERAPRDEVTGRTKNGFFLANQLGKGAVALVFNFQAVEALFTSRYMMDRFRTQGRRAWANVDGGIVTSLKKSQFYEFCHHPSLVQHTGKASTMSNPRHPQAPSFPGEGWDARTLLQEE